MSVEEHKTKALRFFEEVWNKGNLDAIGEFTADNYQSNLPGGPPQDFEGFKQFVAAYRNAFPDINMKVEDMIAEGDKVLIRWTVTGTHRGDFMGFPPTGKSVSATGMTLLRYEGGKSAEAWANFDALGMMQQLGVIPTPR